MIWIFAFVLLALAALSPAFRRFGLALVGVAILVIIALILVNDRLKKVVPPVTVAPPPVPRQRMMDHDDYVLSMRDQRDPLAAQRIGLSEVRFGDVGPAADTPLIGTQGAEPTVFHEVQARLYNDSKRFTLTNYSYDLTVQDCVAERCTTVYEQSHRGVPLLIPPGQARDVTIALQADPNSGTLPFKLLGKARLQLACSEVRAYQTPEGLQPPDSSSAAGNGTTSWNLP